ncbi:MAG: hypothetical protein ACJAZO_005257 [Myxococcota bacterium]|jgi:hypothetical protein
MTWRSLSLLALITPLTLVGCPPEDPSETGDVDTSGTEGTDDTDTEGTDDEGTEGTDAPDFDCHVLPSSLPDWTGDLDPPALGTTTPFGFDAGLDDVIAALPASGETATVNIAVTGAVVTTLGFNPESDSGVIHTFYVGDATGGALVRLDFTDDTTAVDVVPGDAVDFTVTTMENFNGLLQIAAISDLTVTSQGNEVYIVAATGLAIDTINDISVVHQLHGELTSSESGCGGSSVCFDFETRDGETAVVSTLRINNNNLQTPLIEGDCLQVNAPLTQFSGDAQFNIGNFAWQRWYGNIND